MISGGEGEEMEIEVSDNPYDVTSLDTSNVPIIVTLSLVSREETKEKGINFIPRLVACSL